VTKLPSQPPEPRRLVPRVTLIRNAALRHFALHGYDAASMRQIAADAGITIATLYFHCSTKEQLLFDVLESHMRDLSAGLDSALAAAGEHPATRLAAAIRFHIQYVTRDEEGASISTTELRGLTGDLRERHQASRDAYEQCFRRLLTDGIAGGVFAPVDVPVIVAGILGIGLSVGRWYRPGGRLTPDQIADEYITFVLNALDASIAAPRVPDRGPRRAARSGRRSP